MKFESLLREAASVALNVMEEQQCCSSIKQQNGGTDASGARTSGDAVVDDDDLDDGSNIPLSSCDGNKKSLFIGINYFGSRAELCGCLNDVKNMKKFVVDHFGFPTDPKHMKTLIDNDRNNMPTKDNIIRAMKWLVNGASSGDSLFLHYSGHGGNQRDTDGDEIDGMDETLIPCDFEKAGQIVDDDIHAILVAGLPKGVRLTAIMDCCHSGSVFDLPYTYNIDGNLEIQEVDNRKEALNAAFSAGMSLMKGDKKGALLSGVRAISLYYAPSSQPNEEAARQRQIKIRSTVADVIQFSGCRDEQTSADAHIEGEHTGAMSWSFREAFRCHGYDQTYVELLGNIRKLLYGKYTQVPQMSTGHRMNMKTTFKM